MNPLPGWFRGHLYHLNLVVSKKKLKNPLLSAISMGDKYLLHTINEIVSMVNLLRDLIYL